MPIFWVLTFKIKFQWHLKQDVTLFCQENEYENVNGKWGPFCPDSNILKRTKITKIMGPTWGPPGSCGPQMGPCWPHEPCYQGKYSHATTALSLFLSRFAFSNALSLVLRFRRGFKHCNNCNRIITFTSTCINSWNDCILCHSNPVDALL